MGSKGAQHTPHLKNRIFLKNKRPPTPPTKNIKKSASCEGGGVAFCYSTKKRHKKRSGPYNRGSRFRCLKTLGVNILYHGAGGFCSFLSERTAHKPQKTLFYCSMTPQSRAPLCKKVPIFALLLHEFCMICLCFLPVFLPSFYCISTRF